jgi:hypothetical protein
VAAGLGGAPWVQSLVRLVAGGDGASPLPAATKAAAVGLGALALVGGGGDLAQTRHHLSETQGHAAPRHEAHARARRPVTLTGAAAVTARIASHSALERSQTRGGDSRESSSGSGHLGTSSGDGSDDATAALAQPTTSGSSDGGGSTPTTSGSDGSVGSSSDGGSSGSSSGSDGGSDSTTTTTTTTSTTTTSSGSDGTGSDGSGLGGRDGGGTDGG